MSAPVVPAGEDLRAPAIVNEQLTDEQQALSKIRASQLAGAQEQEQVALRQALRREAKLACDGLADTRRASFCAHKDLSAQLKITHKEIREQLKKSIEQANQIVATAYANSIKNDVAGGRAAIAVSIQDRRTQ